MFTLKIFLSLGNSILMVRIFLNIILDLDIKLLKFPFIYMDVCRTTARGNTFIWIYVRLYAGGGVFDTMLSNKIFD